MEELYRNEKAMVDTIYESLKKVYCVNEMTDLTIDEAVSLKEHIENCFDSMMVDLINDVKKSAYLKTIGD